MAYAYEVGNKYKKYKGLKSLTNTGNTTLA